jgi:hypothetical protein
LKEKKKKKKNKKRTREELAHQRKILKNEFGQCGLSQDGGRNGCGRWTSKSSQKKAHKASDHRRRKNSRQGS